MPGRRLRRRPGRAPPGDGCEVARHLAGPERAVVHVDAPEGPVRDRTALGKIRADVELRTRGEIDPPVVDRLAHQLPVDVQRVLIAVPDRRHLMPLALPPLGDRSAHAARATGVVDELEAEEADVLDDLEPPVAQVHQRGVVLVALLPPRLQPERHGSRRARYLADVGDLDLCLGLVCRVAAVERDVGPRIAGARVRGPGRGAPRARLSRPRLAQARRAETTRRLVPDGARGEGTALSRSQHARAASRPAVGAEAACELGGILTDRRPWNARGARFSPDPAAVAASGRHAGGG